MSLRYVLLLVGLVLLSLAWLGAGSFAYFVLGIEWVAVTLTGFGSLLFLALLYKIFGRNDRVTA